MVYAFDSLSYAKRLREAGIPPEQAEAHAEAAREYVMAELVTRHDLDVVRRELDTAITTSVASVRQEVAAVRRDLESAIDRQTLRLTVRLGGMLAFAIAALATLIKL